MIGPPVSPPFEMSKQQSRSTMAMKLVYIEEQQQVPAQQKQQQDQQEQEQLQEEQEREEQKQRERMGVAGPRTPSSGGVQEDNLPENEEEEEEEEELEPQDEEEPGAIIEKKKLQQESALCNEFLLQRKRMLPVSERKKRRQRFYYGTLDQADEIDGGRFRLLFSVLSGPWFHSQIDWAQRARDGETENYRFFASVPLFLVQIDFSASEILSLAQLGGAQIGAAPERPPTVDVARALLSLERRWVRIETESGGGRGAFVFHNLFEPPTRIRVASIRTASVEVRQILNDLDPLRDRLDSTLDEIGRQLPISRGKEYLAVYDVGQGEAVGLVQNRTVRCYFDFGGGVAGNRKTFPKRIKQFCLCGRPPIILSHWDTIGLPKEETVEFIVVLG
jgi:hypothetical protein